MEHKSFNTVKRAFLGLVLLLSASFAYGQELVFEVTWTDQADVTYNGLVVLMNNEGGFIKEYYYSENSGKVWVRQDITAEVDIDRLGNQIIYLIGSNPQTDNDDVVYYADTFVIYPNSTWFTQDANGNSSEDIHTSEVATSNWQSKFREYKINISNDTRGNDTQRFGTQGNDTRHL